MTATKTKPKPLNRYAIMTHVRKRVLETPVQKRVLMALAYFADEHGEVHRPTREIAIRARACEDTVQRVIHELEVLGELEILSMPRACGYYRIKKLSKVNKADSMRNEIVEAIRLYDDRLTTRISDILEAFARYANKNGKNIFPNITTIAEDTGYDVRTVRETLKWFLQVGVLATDIDCVNQKYQSRPGYYLPGWRAEPAILVISDAQLDELVQLHHLRNKKHFFPELVEEKSKETWLDDGAWPDDSFNDPTTTASENRNAWSEDEAQSPWWSTEEETFDDNYNLTSEKEELIDTHSDETVNQPQPLYVPSLNDSYNHNQDYTHVRLTPQSRFGTYLATGWGSTPADKERQRKILEIEKLEGQLDKYLEMQANYERDPAAVDQARLPMIQHYISYYQGRIEKLDQELALE